MNEFQAGRPTLVFVHGLSGSSSAWFLYEKEFESTCNILSFDLRGHGKSEKPLSYEDYQIENFADDLHELIEFLHIGNFILIGHSLGSFVVLAYLQKHQNKVSKVVFLAPNFSGRNMLSARIISPFVSIGVFVLECVPFSGRARRHIDYSRYPNSGDWNIPRMIADIGNTSLHVYLYVTKQGFYFDAERFLGDIAVPTLIIHGGRDTIFPVRYGALMAEKIGGSKLVRIENADHILVLNKAEKVIDEMKKFINQ